jgi:hypothetical protein
MNAATKYLQNAEDCIELARRMDGVDRTTLLRLASAWRDLVEQELRRMANENDPTKRRS